MLVVRFHLPFLHSRALLKQKKIIYQRFKPCFNRLLSIRLITSLFRKYCAYNNPTGTKYRLGWNTLNDLTWDLRALVKVRTEMVSPGRMVGWPRGGSHITVMRVLSSIENTITRAVPGGPHACVRASMLQAPWLVGHVALGGCGSPCRWAGFHRLACLERAAAHRWWSAVSMTKCRIGLLTSPTHCLEGNPTKDGKLTVLWNYWTEGNGNAYSNHLFSISGLVV